MCSGFSYIHVYHDITLFGLHIISWFCTIFYTLEPHAKMSVSYGNNYVTRIYEVIGVPSKIGLQRLDRYTYFADFQSQINFILLYSYTPVQY